MEDDIGANARMLLGLGLGDKHILGQIYRASVNGEIISNHERQYVSSLVEEHAVAMPDKPPPIIPTMVEQVAVPSQPKKSNTPLIIAAAGIAVAVVIASIILVMPASPGASVDLPVAYMQIDQDTYQAGDFMVVSGVSDYTVGDSVRVDILDGDDNNVWSESVVTRPDGSYSTIILVGQGDWIAGVHTLQVAHGDTVHMTDFIFDD